MATIKLADVTLHVSDSHLITAKDHSGEVIKTVQCAGLSEVLKEVAIFAVSEYRESPVDSEFDTIQAID